MDQFLIGLALTCGMVAFWLGLARGELSGPLMFTIFVVVAGLVRLGAALS